MRADFDHDDRRDDDHNDDSKWATAGHRNWEIHREVQARQQKGSINTEEEQAVFSPLKPTMMWRSWERENVVYSFWTNVCVFAFKSGGKNFLNRPEINCNCIPFAFRLGVSMYICMYEAIFVAFSGNWGVGVAKREVVSGANIMVVSFGPFLYYSGRIPINYFVCIRYLRSLLSKFFFTFYQMREPISRFSW